MRQTIFITGASSGIGKETAKYFQINGWNVVATIRNPENETELISLENVFVTKLDVLDLDSINQAISKGIEKFGGIDVLLNNAGYGAYGPLESFPRENILRQFNTNVIGLLDVTRAILPHFRENKKGIIMNVSSMGGKMTFPLGSLYHGTKFAVEGLTETLAGEVSGFGIKVTIVEPGGFSTDFFGTTALALSESIQAYDNVRKDFYQHAGEQDSGNPAATAKALVKLVYSENPPLRLLLGKIAFSWVQHTYSERLKTWESWQDVSVAAHG